MKKGGQEDQMINNKNKNVSEDAGNSWAILPESVL